MDSWGKAWAKNGNKIDKESENDALVQMLFSFQGSPVFSGSIRGVVPRRGTPQKSNHRYQKWPYLKGVTFSKSSSRVYFEQFFNPVKNGGTSWMRKLPKPRLETLLSRLVP